MAVIHTLASVCEVRGEKMLKRVGGSIGFSSNTINLEITSLWNVPVGITAVVKLMKGSDLLGEVIWWIWQDCKYKSVSVLLCKMILMNINEGGQNSQDLKIAFLKIKLCQCNDCKPSITSALFWQFIFKLMSWLPSHALGVWSRLHCPYLMHAFHLFWNQHCGQLWHTELWYQRVSNVLHAWYSYLEEEKSTFNFVAFVCVCLCCKGATPSEQDLAKLARESRGGTQQSRRGFNFGSLALVFLSFSVTPHTIPV